MARNTKNFTIVYGVSNKYASHGVRTMDLVEQQASCPDEKRVSDDIAPGMTLGTVLCPDQFAYA